MSKARAGVSIRGHSVKGGYAAGPRKISELKPPPKGPALGMKPAKSKS